METAGLKNILALCENFGVPDVTAQVNALRKLLAEDEQQLRDRLDQQILGSFTEPQDVYNAIFAKIKDTKAQDHFLSMMQHLLLIREEGQPMVHYYQFLDSLVTDVVMDKKLLGAEQRFGHSVERIIAQFNEADRLQAVELEAAEAKALAVRLKLEKEALEDEVAQGQDGLVGNLKIQLVQMEEKLKNSRETASRLQGQLETQKVAYEERIAQLEAQIMELFRMLKEVGVETILDRGTVDQKTFIQTLEKTFQRHRTISILEGRARKKRSGVNGTAEDDDEGEDDDPDSTPGKTSLRRSRPPGSMGKRNPSKSARQMGKIVDENGRVSQFMDAEEADAQEQIQQQMVAGAKMVRFKHLFSEQAADQKLSILHRRARSIAYGALEVLPVVLINLLSLKLPLKRPPFYLPDRKMLASAARIVPLLLGLMMMIVTFHNPIRVASRMVLTTHNQLLPPPMTLNPQRLALLLNSCKSTYVPGVNLYLLSTIALLPKLQNLYRKCLLQTLQVQMHHRHLPLHHLPLLRPRPRHRRPGGPRLPRLPHHHPLQVSRHLCQLLLGRHLHHLLHHLLLCLVQAQTQAPLPTPPAPLSWVPISAPYAKRCLLHPASR